jgi:hypothetical protein
MLTARFRKFQKRDRSFKTQPQQRHGLVHIYLPNLEIEENNFFDCDGEFNRSAHLVLPMSFEMSTCDRSEGPQ